MRAFLGWWARFGVENSLAVMVWGNIVYGNIIAPILLFLQGYPLNFLKGLPSLITVGLFACVALGFINGFLLAVLHKFSRGQWRFLVAGLMAASLLPSLTWLWYGERYISALLQGDFVVSSLDLIVAGFNSSDALYIPPFAIALGVCLELAAWQTMSRLRHRWLPGATQP